VETRIFPIKNPEIGERTLHIHAEAVKNKGPDEVRAHVNHLYDVFRRAEKYAEAQDHTYTDEEALKRATELYKGVGLIIITNCFSVYTTRLEEDTEEARTEQAYLDDLNEKIDINEHIDEALEKSAGVLSRQWIEESGPEHAQELVRAVDSYATKQLVAAAILAADEEVSPEAPDGIWRASFDRLYKAQVKSGIEDVYSLYMENEAQNRLEEYLKPVERSLKELRLLAGIVYLEAKAKGGKFSDRPEPQTLSVELKAPSSPEYIWSLSMMPAQTIDRAARGIGGWSFPQGDAPTFEDANNKHAVTYFADGLTQEALREGVMQLNPRTADVWRLVTATILESWGKGEREPPRVWLDARQLCDTMSFKKHHKGGHRPENVAIAARALVDLERFYITIPYGAKQYPADANGKRKRTTVQARARHRVLAVMAKEEAKQLFDTEWLPMRWLVTAGDWIKAYPREQFAPLFRALVELPGTYTPDLWAKAIGTELVWQYRQDEGKVQIQRVETMLRQACVLEDARQDHRKGRVRENFEKAMDTLQRSGVCTAWEYSSPDIDRVEATTRGWFGLWLQARVIVTPPPEVTKALASVAKTKKQHRRRPKKA